MSLYIANILAFILIALGFLSLIVTLRLEKRSQFITGIILSSITTIIGLISLIAVLGYESPGEKDFRAKLKSEREKSMQEYRKSMKDLDEFRKKKQ